MRINPIAYGLLVLIIFMGIILGFQEAGVWSVSGKITASGDQVQPVAGNVDTIKGWMTLEQISTTYNVPTTVILLQFELPADTASTTAIKDLETDLFSVTSLRTWLQSRIQPAQAPQDISSPTAPIQQTSSSPTVPASGDSEPTENAVTDKTVTGKTTFQELLDWGVSRDAIQNVIGGEFSDPSVSIREFVTSKGMGFPTIKSHLQSLVDQTE